MTLLLVHGPSGLLFQRREKPLKARLQAVALKSAHRLRKSRRVFFAYLGELFDDAFGYTLCSCTARMAVGEALGLIARLRTATPHAANNDADSVSFSDYLPVAHKNSAASASKGSSLARILSRSTMRALYSGDVRRLFACVSSVAQRQFSGE
jgi:hypothetical protein